MATFTGAGGTGCLASRGDVEMAAAAQLMKHGFHLSVDLWIVLVAIQAETLASVVCEVVVAADAVLLSVVDVGKVYGKQRGKSQLVIARLEDCSTRGIQKGNDHQCANTVDPNNPRQMASTQAYNPLKNTTAKLLTQLHLITASVVSACGQRGRRGCHHHTAVVAITMPPNARGFQSWAVR